MDDYRYWPQAERAGEAPVFEHSLIDATTLMNAAVSILKDSAPQLSADLKKVAAELSKGWGEVARSSGTVRELHCTPMTKKEF